MGALTTKMAHLRKIIRKGDPEQAIALLQDVQDYWTEKQINYLKMIEIGSKVCCPMGDRELTVERTEGTQHKLTINPVDGRVSLKITSRASEIVVAELMDLACQLETMELPPITLRGKITWHKGKGYECQLVSGSKKFKIMLRENTND